MIEIRHTPKVDPNATRSEYDRIYSSEGIMLRDSFYLWIISLLKPVRGHLLADLACGQGRLSVLAKQKGLRCIGVDFSLQALVNARMDSSDIMWIASDGENLSLPDNSCDYVTNIGSLEHYEDPLSGMREIARVLKPSGGACILVPNSYGLLGNIKHVWQTGHVYIDEQPLQRYNTRYGWEQMLISSGLRPYKVLKYERERPRTWQDLVWHLMHIQKLIRLLFITPFVPVNLGNSLVFLCRKAIEN